MTKIYWRLAGQFVHRASNFKKSAPEEDSITIIRNIGKYFSVYTAYHFKNFNNQ